MSAVRISMSRVGECQHHIPSIPSVPLISAALLARNVREQCLRQPSPRRTHLRRQGQRHVRTTCEISAGTQRPVSCTPDDVGVEQRQDRVDHHLTAHQRTPSPECAPKESSPKRPRAHQGTHPGRVRADEGALQLLAPIGWNHRRASETEAGGYAYTASSSAAKPRRSRHCGRLHQGPVRSARTCTTPGAATTSPARATVEPRDDIARRDFSSVGNLRCRRHHAASADFESGGSVAAMVGSILGTRVLRTEDPELLRQGRIRR